MKKIILGLIGSFLAINVNAALINIYESDSYLYSIARSESVINSAVTADTSVNSDTIFFNDKNHYGADPFPDSHNTTFVLTATGYLDTSLYSALSFYHDDGLTASINDTTVYSFDGNTALKNSGWISFADTGMAAFDLLFWENQGWATLLVYGQLRDSLTTEIANISTTASIPEPSSIALFGVALIGFGAFRRKGRKA